MDEVTAILAYQHGDAEAFRVLFDLHGAHVYRTTYLILHDRERAEDVAQETFLILSQRLPGLIPGPLRSWLGRVAANLSLNDRRWAWELPLDLLLEAAELRAQLLAAVAALAPRQRAIVVLRFYGDCSHAEICRALGCRTGTVRATVHQAIRRLRAAGAGNMVGTRSRLPDRNEAPLTLERGDPTYEG